MRLLKREYVADYTGPGRWRGAPGLETEILYAAPTQTNVMLAGVHNPTRGFCGGIDGAPNRLRLSPGTGPEEEIPETAYNYAMPAGGVIGFLRGGGGGWGDPLERPVSEVLDDVNNGYVTVAGALRDYGIAINNAGAVDALSTEKERCRRQQRQDTAPK